MTKPQIVWLRRDLRLADQPALHHAASLGPVIPVYVLDDERAGDHKLGAASRWWLHHSLASLAASLEKKGSRLILRRGPAPQVLAQLVDETGAGAVHALRHYEPWWRKAEDELAKLLEQSADLALHDGNYLRPPGSVTTGSGQPYKIYTPFAKALNEEMPPPEPLPEPPAIPAPDRWPDSDALDDWRLLPTAPDWAGGMRKFWAVGEEAAHERLDWWKEHVADYGSSRNLPSDDRTSRFSPHLHWGELSPAQVWHSLCDTRGDGWQTFAKELMWRDYAQNVICQYPDYASSSYRKLDEKTLWRDPAKDPAAASDLEAWQQGCTGYPIVDAGMRQLWQVGWMHNRVRMITASFLVKHLLIDWRHGEQWFWDCLVDADYGNNGVNWQWIAGTGVDSNMFTRIMAPLTQSEKFAAQAYIRTYVPELAEFDDEAIHDPPDDRRGSYPVKRIGHREARERALAAYRKSRA